MFLKIIWLLVSVFLLVEGIYMIVKGRSLSSKSSDEKSLLKYTEESYTRATRVMGIFISLAAIALGLWNATRAFNFVIPGYNVIGLIIVGVCIAIGFVLYFVLLKKRPDYEKGTGTYSENYTNNPGSSGKGGNDNYIDED